MSSAAYVSKSPNLGMVGRRGDTGSCGRHRDFPHSEGTATPLADYERAGCDAATPPELYCDNAAFLLGAR